jgi:hypothetical protein
MAEFKLVNTESDINVANNSSKLTSKLYLKTTDAHSSNLKNGNITIDGTVYNFTASFPNTGVEYLLHTASKVITHDTDGSKTVTVSGYFDGRPTTLGEVTTSESVDLTTIQRASVLANIAAFNIEQGISALSYTKYVAEFTHQLVILVNGAAVITINPFSAASGQP